MLTPATEPPLAPYGLPVPILVTRLDPGRYEARLNAELPLGTTRESWGESSDEPRQPWYPRQADRHLATVRMRHGQATPCSLSQAAANLAARVCLGDHGLLRAEPARHCTALSGERIRIKSAIARATNPAPRFRPRREVKPATRPDMPGHGGRWGPNRRTPAADLSTRRSRSSRQLWCVSDPAPGPHG